MDKTQFADPGPAYRGVALWMLNDRFPHFGMPGGACVQYLARDLGEGG